MDIEKFLSPLISSAGLLWAVYAFYIKKKEQDDKDARDALYLVVRKTEDNLTNELNKTEQELKSMRQEIERLKESFLNFSPRISAGHEQLNESLKRMERALDKYDQKLDSFGKVIMK